MFARITDKRTDRRTDRQTDRMTDRLTDKQIEKNYNIVVTVSINMYHLIKKADKDRRKPFIFLCHCMYPVYCLINVFKL